jgi:putative transposase
MGKMQSNNIVAYTCRYHLVYCPKYRRKALVSPIDEGLKTIFDEQVEQRGQELIEVQVMPNHVHLLVGCDPQFGAHRLIQLPKGYSSHALHKELVHTEATAAISVDELLLCGDYQRCHPGDAQTLDGKQKG